MSSLNSKISIETQTAINTKNAQLQSIEQKIKNIEKENKIESKTKKKFDENMKEAILRERMRSIQKELGEGGEEEEIAELRTKLKKAKLPKEVELKAKKELDRLAKLSLHNPETSYLRTWLETVLELPWNVYTKSNYSLAKAEKILNQDHYGLEKVKERILEYISVLKLKSEQVKKNKKKSINAPTILCFAGPPGVGKT